MKNNNTLNIDKEFVELLSNKANDIIGILKDHKDLNYFNYKKDEIIDIIKKNNKGPLDNETLEAIYKEVLFASVQKVKPVKAAFLGPAGTFSHLALIEFFGRSIDGVPVKTIPDVFDEVETGRADYGVVPVENSTEGAVTFTLDEFLETDLTIISEKNIRISYCLLSMNKDISAIDRVYSHPQPLGQCKNWIRKNIPGAEIHSVDSTSKAAGIVKDEKNAAAIASEIAAELYGLHVIQKNVEDLRQNYTRFFVIGRSKNNPTGNDKTSILCAIKDNPGALLNLLKPFSDSGINMTKIESRPDKKKMWQYNFFIDFTGHTDDRVVIETLEQIKQETIFLKILGSYPSGS